MVQTNFIRKHLSKIKDKKKMFTFLGNFSETRLAGILSDRMSCHKLVVSEQNTVGT